MAPKIGSWLIGLGCFFAFAGLCFLPAAFGAHPDNAMLGAGAMVFSLGMVLAACGFYIKARYWAAAGAPASSKSSGARSRTVPCDLCAKQDAVIQCRVHQLQLCAGCVAEHYDFRSCVYVPSVRQGTNKARAHAHAGA